MSDAMLEALHDKRQRQQREVDAVQAIRDRDKATYEESEQALNRAKDTLAEINREIVQRVGAG